MLSLYQSHSKQLCGKWIIHAVALLCISGQTRTVMDYYLKLLRGEKHN